jgi:hypothetical protein
VASPKSTVEASAQVAERQLWDAVSKSTQAQRKARQCISSREVLAGRPASSHARAVHAEMRELGCPALGTPEQEAEKRCVDARDRVEMFDACSEYAKFDVPDAVRSSTAAAQAAHAKDVEQIRRDLSVTLERDVASHAQRCARGEQDYCAAAACGRLGLDDSDANLVACIKAQGLRYGNGWVATSHGQYIPGIPRPDWHIDITCMHKVNGERPWVTLWRKFGVPESAFDLETEATKACQAKYAEARGKGPK